jgi:hypothetical protein
MLVELPHEISIKVFLGGIAILYITILVAIAAIGHKRESVISLDLYVLLPLYQSATGKRALSRVGRMLGRLQSFRYDLSADSSSELKLLHESLSP